jgi:molybdopterin synthase sulfur carrier subunit
MTRLLFFGRLRDIAGAAQLAETLPAEVATVADVRAWLARRDPILGEAIAAPGVRVAVNQALCLSDADVARGADEIAFMSPLSGG